MEEVSGKPSKAFFRQWVYSPGQPVITGDWGYADGVLTVALHQTQSSDIVYRTGLDVGIITDRNAAPNVEVLQLDRRDQTFRITQDKEPSEVVLDPNTWLLMRAGTFTKKAPSQSR